MFLTRTHLSRRAVLKGLGAVVSLPLLDAMTPAGAWAAPRRPPRLVCIEIVHGAAGSSPFGLRNHLWAPAATGRGFDLAGTSLEPLAAYRDHLTIVSNADVPSANATDAREIGGDHFRSTAVFLTQSYPKRTDGSDIEVGTSLDQLYAQRTMADTPIPSMQLCIENVDQGGGCAYGYSCAYVDSLSWATPHKPLPMVQDPRVVFDQLMRVYGVGPTPEERIARAAEEQSLLDGVVRAAARLRSRLGAGDRARLDDYLDTVRQIERRIQKVEAFNRSGEERQLPDAPAAVPDDFEEHVRLMFDLQMLAFTNDITRVVTFKLSRDGSNRTYPDSGFAGPFHNTSHHGNNDDRIRDLARINRYHVGMLAYFLDRLKTASDGEATMLDNSLVMYGSPMGDPNFHNHKKVPFVMLGHAGGALPGGVHHAVPDGTPLSNVMLTTLRLLGLHDLESFGDSEGAFGLV